MSESYDTALAFLESEGHRYFKVEEEELAIVTFRSDDGPIRCHIKVYDDRDLAMVEAFAPFAAPKRRRREMYKLACLVNRYLISGCLSVDPDDGEIVFRSSSCYTEYSVQPDLYKRLLSGSMSALTEHINAIHAVVFDGKSAAEAMADEEEEDADAPTEAAGEPPAGEEGQAEQRESQ